MTESLFADRYRIIRQIGSGGMGVVYEAEDQLLNKTVAIKTIKKGVLTGDLVMRFQREANALAVLNHPNLVPIFIFGITDDNQPYLVMQYEQGKPLSELIEARGRLPLFKSINIFLQLASAIQHAHEHGVLHRDLKPSNVILKNYERENPDVVLIDFGIAMVANNNSMDSLTKTGILLGTPAYMSPEQVTGRELDERSDIYSLGCVMYETLTGLQPFTANSALELLTLKTSQEAPSINSAYPDLVFPCALEAIIARCLSTNPSMRYENMKALKEDLLKFKSGDYSVHAPQEKYKGKPEVVNASSRRSRKMIFTLVASTFTILLVSVTVVFAILGTQPSEKNKPIIKIDDEHFKVKEHCLHVLGLAGDDAQANDNLVRKWIFQNHSDITAVDLNGANVSGTCFQGCQEIPITDITATDVNFSDEGLEAISKIKTLTTLRVIQGDKFTADGVAKLASLPSLQRVSFKDCQFEDRKIKALCASKQLTWIELQGNLEVGDEAVKIISDNIPNLKYLDLDETGIKTEGFKSLTKLKHLDQLLLRKVAPSHEAIEAISSMQLTTIDLKDNDNLTVDDLALLKKMPKLKSLDISSRQIPASAIEQIRKSNPTLTVNSLKPQGATGGRTAEEMIREGATIAKREKENLLANSNLHDRPTNMFMSEKDARGLKNPRASLRGKLKELNFAPDIGDREAAVLLAQEAKEQRPSTTIRAVLSEITGSCFKDCPLRIETLIFNGNKISNTGMYNIGQLKDLKNLRLKDEVYLDNGLAHLSSVPNLESVYIAECRFDEKSLASLTSSKSLSTLYIRKCLNVLCDPNNLLSGDAALIALANGGGPNLEELSWLRMGTPGKGALKNLKKLRKLKTLRLSNLGLKDWSVEDLAELNVETLDLRNNNELSYKALGPLQKMKKLKSLIIDDQNFEMSELKRRFPELAKKTSIERKDSAKANEREMDKIHFE